MMRPTPVNGYEGLYSVYPNGEVFSHRRNKPLAKTLNEKGYQRVRLIKDRKVKWCFVHRLVGKAFIPNTFNLPQINHINGVKTENHVENLEWVSLQENVAHAIANGLSPNMVCLTETQIAEAFEKFVRGKPLAVLHKEYFVGVSLNSWVKEYANKHGRTHEFNAALKAQSKRRGIAGRPETYKVLQKSVTGELLAVFGSVKEAAESTGVSRPTIALGTKNSNKEYRGFTWEKQYLV